MRRPVFPPLFAGLSLALAVLVLSGNPLASAEKPRRLALLIAAPHGGEVAMQNDQTVVYQALQRRGFQPEQILTLGGPVSRSLVLAFLRDAAERVAKWPDGSVFLAYSGHGTFVGEEVTTAKPGLLLPTREKILWEEVFDVLRLTKEVRLTLLPDC
jgi:hypothetical protein